MKYRGGSRLERRGAAVPYGRRVFASPPRLPSRGAAYLLASPGERRRRRGGGAAQRRAAKGHKNATSVATDSSSLLASPVFSLSGNLIGSKLVKKAAIAEAGSATFYRLKVSKCPRERSERVCSGAKRNAFDSVKDRKCQRRKRQSVTAKQEKSQTPKFVTAK